MGKQNRRRSAAQPPTSWMEGLEPRRLLSGDTLNDPALAADVTAAAAGLTKQVENLDRGVVAVRAGTSKAYISWRLLGLDPSDIAFNLYRSANGGAAVKLNASPITQTTDYSDTTANFTQSNSYYVCPIINGVEGSPSKACTIQANAAVGQYLSVPLQIPPGGTTPTGETYTYNANDASVGDLDGDGQYEIVLKWDPSNAKDNSQSGYTGNVYLDAYKLDGTRLWRIDLGRNIRAGAHYTQFIVYDLDGDGKAEVACKTADGTVDGQGTVIGDGSADWRNSSGYILTGPEYLTIFNGQTGAAMATTNYLPARGSVSSWGDSYGNRVDRFLACVAYLDGQRPSLVMCRGYYTRAVLVAWDWRNGTLTRRWTFDSDDGTPGNSAYRGQGAHSLSVGDLDGDGFDEILYGSCAIDHNGTGLYSTGLGHGDALHLTDMDPAHPGLESFMVHESPESYGDYGGDYRAGDGTLLLGVPGNDSDVGRGLALDIDPRYPGYEMWCSADGNIYNVSGQVVGSKGNIFTNFGIQWDADPLSELLDGTTIADWNYTAGGRTNLVYAPSGLAANNGTKNTPCLVGDILGDWREEVIWRQADNQALQIWTTTIAATNRMYTMMHDVEYRESIAWQNVAYNQPPHPSFYLGSGMSAPPTPNVRYAGITLPGDVVTTQGEAGAFGGGSTADSNNAGFNGTAFINFPTTGGYLQFNNVSGGLGGATTLRFRYALGATASRTGRLLINGVTQNITFTATGSWTTWATLSVPVILNSGTVNTIRLESTGQDLGNVDELQVDLPASSVLAGSASGDVLSLSATGTTGQFQAAVNGQSYSMLMNASLVYINGLDGNDQIAVDMSAGTVTGTIQIDGGLGNNTLTIHGLPAGQPVSFNGTLLAAGTLQFNLSNIQTVRLLASGNLTLTGGTLALLAGSTLGNVVLNGSARLVAPAGLGLLTVQGALSLGGTSQFDLNDNPMIVRSGNESTMLAYLRLGRLVSSAAVGDTTRRLAPLSGQKYHLYLGASALFEGQSVADSDTLVKYTMAGDADLSGRITLDDYAQLDNGFLFHGVGWSSGDFNYDGMINSLDYQLIDNAFASQGTSALAESLLAAHLARFGDVSAAVAADETSATTVETAETSALDGVDAAYVCQLYKTLLGRQAETAGVTYWLGRMAAGATHTEIAAEITASQEYQARQIDRFYETYLGRAAESAGKAYWISRAQQGEDLETLRRQILASDEYFQHAGDRTVYVEALYGALLNRAADALGTSYWMAQLAAGNQEARKQVVAGMADSLEAAQVAIQEYYRRYLHRAADTQETADWMQAGTISDRMMTCRLTGSDEYWEEASVA